MIKIGNCFVHENEGGIIQAYHTVDMFTCTIPDVQSKVKALYKSLYVHEQRFLSVVTKTLIFKSGCADIYAS